MLAIFGLVYDVYASLGLTELGQTVQFVFVEFALPEILCLFRFYRFLQFFEQFDASCLEDFVQLAASDFFAEALQLLLVGHNYVIMLIIIKSMCDCPV